MSVVVEFSLPADAFLFGQSTNGDLDVRVELERLVPLDHQRIPFLWASGEYLEEFETHLQESELVERFEALTRVGDTVLYFVEWYEGKETFLHGIADVDGTIIEAHGLDASWSFTVRFNDHGDLSRFHQFYQAAGYPVYQAAGYPVHIDRVYAPGELSIDLDFGLTDDQREAQVLAVEWGYFFVPRETDLEEIAEELGISSQAASERVRRGAKTVLRRTLLGPRASNFIEAEEAVSAAENWPPYKRT